ncbi:MAG: sulfatase [Planctomycetota bacterium]
MSDWKRRIPLNLLGCAVFLWTLFPWTLFLWTAAAPCRAEEDVSSPTRPPNVLFILADDLGWSDTTLYGTTTFYRTPNIQRLADHGMTFTRAYSSSPLCSPTRASILTGLSPARHGITTPGCHTPLVRLKVGMKPRAAPNQKSIQPDSITRLSPSHETLAEVLQANGYATGDCGKWHLGPEPYSPLQHGFDVDIPHWPGPGPAGSYVAPWKFPDFDHDPDTPDQHIEDRMATEAVSFIREHQDEPFFLNYWMFSVHAPFDAKQSLIEQAAQRVDAKDEQRCPTYAAMIESMDDAVGTLLDELQRLALIDNTIIVFASDNGGNTYNLVDGQRPTSNRPLRGGKATMHEGGIRTPAIICWPGQVEEGSKNETLIQSIDYFPTLVDMLGINVDAKQVFDGVSLVPLFRGQELERDGIFTYFPHSPPVPDWIPPSVSVHDDHWKLTRIFFGGAVGEHRYLLYNLRDDVGEQSNLAAAHPEVVKRLDAMIEEHLRITNAITPLPNPRFDPKQYDRELEGIPAQKFRTEKTADTGQQVRAGAETRGNTPQGNRKRRVRKPVSGWTAGGTCELTIVGNALRVSSSGKDPYLSTELTKPVKPGTYTLKIQMKSTAFGNGQFFWRSPNQRFAAERSTTFKVTHDDQIQRYLIEFSSDQSIESIRIDPSRGRGVVDVTDVSLQRADGTAIQSWTF